MTQQLIGLGTTANDGTGDDARSAGAKINAMMAELYRAARSTELANGAPPKIAFAGHSIAQITGQLRSNSPWFWAQVRNPRLYRYSHKTWDGTTTDGASNIAKGGSWSGAVTGHAAVTTFGGTSPDLNTQLVKDTLIAINPDILYIETGANDTTAVNLEIYNNVKAVVDAVKPLHTIICAIAPRNGFNPTAWQQANNLYRRWEQLDPSIHFLDLYAIYLDDSAAANAPVGGGAGGAGALTLEGTHPSPLLARLAAPELDKILDRIGVPKANFIPTGLASGYHATNNPYGNLLDVPSNAGRGAFTGTAGTHNANGNSTGVVATGYTVTASSGELTCVASKSTLTVDGVSHVAQKLDFTATGTLTAERSVTIASATLQAPATALGFVASLLIHNASLVDCIGINLNLAVAGGIVGPANFGAAYLPSTANAAANIPVVDEIYKYLMPGTGKLVAGLGQMYWQVTFLFRNGATAGSKGSAELAQAVVMPVPDAMP